MSSVVISGDTSGAITLAAPAVAGTNTITFPAQSGTVSLPTLATAQNSTSGTSIDFTGIPAGVKRVTVMFNGVSLSATANLLVQIGISSGIESTGYNSGASAGTSTSTATNGFVLTVSQAATDAFYGIITLVNITGNTWCESGALTQTGTASVRVSAGSKSLGGTLDRIRITSTSTDTFDAGSINILYE